MQRLALFTLGWVLFLTAPAAYATPFPLVLTRTPESVGSWYRPSDTVLKYYDPGSVLTLRASVE